MTFASACNDICGHDMSDGNAVENKKKIFGFNDFSVREIVIEKVAQRQIGVCSSIEERLKVICTENRNSFKLMQSHGKWN